MLLIYVFLLFTIAQVRAQTNGTPAQADFNAVILMYHNVSDDTPDSTSVSPDTFAMHMQYLQDNDYVVWPLYTTLMHLAYGKAIPPKTVMLTFDDAYESVYSQALPVLKDKGYPFTVFVTTQYIAEGYSNFMNWQQLRELQQYGGMIGNHSASHPHFVRTRNGETNADWQQRIVNEIEQSQKILHENGTNPIWAVAYPYGEFSKEIKVLLRRLGYFGLGQHSGVVSYQTDFQAIPRFPMAKGFDSLDDFSLKVATKKLPLTVMSPDDGILSGQSQVPVLTIQLHDGNYKKSSLACFASGQGRIQIDWFDNNVIQVRANRAINPGRTKYNCTAPSLSEEGVYYWFSYLWMMPETDGRWYSE